MAKKDFTYYFFTWSRAIVKALLVYSFLGLFICFGISIVTNFFDTKNPASNAMTYYGFAIFAVLANVIFSLARTYPASDENELRVLRFIGSRFLFCSACFLTGSIINYAIINASKFYPSYNGTGFIVYVINFSKVISGILIVAAFFFGALSMYEIMDNLFERIFLNKTNYRIEKNFEAENQGK